MAVSDPTQPPDETDALESLLRWYVAMGVDSVIDAAPHDRFVAPPPAMTPAPTSPAPVSRSLTPARDGAPTRPLQLLAMPSPDALVAEAKALAAAAGSVEALRAAWEGFQGCTLSATAARMILADGNSAARLMIAAAAPGSDDERAGTAFAGAPGRLMDAMLRAIGLSRETAYLTYLIPWRPPGNRPPTPLEAAVCLPFARRLVQLTQPALILCLGERAAQLLLDTQEPMSRLRGRWWTHASEGATVKTAVTFSLDYLLSQPLQKRRAWIDLTSVAKRLETKESEGAEVP